ncbi:MAG: hypothetical protein Q8P86_01905 [bacterium]|nr:hypothetical protein [bacterium]
MFNFLMKKMVKAKLKNIPDAEQEKVMAMIDKNPALFKQIADEVQAKVKEGKDQYTASIEVMKTHEAELKAMLK